MLSTKPLIHPMEIKIPSKRQISSYDNLLDDGSTLSQFSPDSSPLLKPSFQPSEVLLFKGVPGDLREIEVMPLFERYGQIKDILVAHHKRYLFVQFEDEDQAIKCYQDFTASIPQIRNHDLYACYTGKSKISKPKALLNPPSRFLHLKFSPNYVEVTSSQIAQMLSCYNANLRIVIRRTKTWEAFIELEDIFLAIMIKDYINSQNLVSSQITVNFTSEKDFHNEEQGIEELEEFKDKDPNSDDFALPSAMMETTAPSYEEYPNFNMTAFPCFPLPYLNGGSPIVGMSSNYSNVNAVGSPVLGLSASFSNNSPSLRASSPLSKQGSPILKGMTHMGSHSMILNPSSPILGAMSPAIGGSPVLLPVTANHFNPVSNVLLVKNLPDNITPLMLFRLFGMYGNVMKIKILFNNPEKAFIEFQSSPQAELARTYLADCHIMGKALKVDFAKKGTIVDISLLKKEPENKYLGDFANSSEHRYKYVGSKNHANISPPSKVLHLSNMHPDKTEAFYKELFRDYGRITKFIFMKCEEKMALVQMNSIEDALSILMHFHNYDVDGKYLKVSFSKYKKVKG